MTQSDSTDASDGVVVMIALSQATAPDAGAVAASLAQRLPDVELGDVHRKDGSWLVEVGDALAAVSLIPAPIPWEELAGPAATAWWWPEAEEQLKTHQAHLIVALLGGQATPVTRHVQMSHFVSAVAEHSPAIGVYWGAGTVVHEAGNFRDHSVGLSSDELQPELWIDMRVEQNEDGTYRYFTTGMAAFGHKELEADGVTMAPEELFDFCYSIIYYILSENVGIASGETIGRSPEERYKVTHADSMWPREGPVLRMALP